MERSIAFPSEQAKLAEDVDDYRACTPEERIQSLLEICSLCDEIRRSSPAAARQQQLLEEREEAENARWRELIRTHEGRDLTSRSSG
jgi:hypothetical protein